jgi:hypothetical protein
MARPLELNDQLIDLARSYLTDYTTAIPSRAGLSKHLKINRDTIYDWEKKAKDSDVHQQFSDILKQLDADQEIKLLNSGLTGDFNSTITKLILTKHGYSDKTQQELTGAGGEAITIQIVKFGDNK